MVEPDVHRTALVRLCQQTGDTVNHPVAVSVGEQLQEGPERVGVSQVNVEAFGVRDAFGDAEGGELLTRAGQGPPGQALPAEPGWDWLQAPIGRGW